jgi:hypothetical protein
MVKMQTLDRDWKNKTVKHPDTFPSTEYREMARNRGKGFYECWCAVFRFLQVECDMGMDKLDKKGKLNTSRNEEQKAAETAYKFCEYCERLENQRKIKHNDSCMLSR